MKQHYWLIALLLLAGNAHADEYYRSITNSGKVHYGDAPLRGTDDVEILKSKSEPPPSESLPFLTRRAKEKFPVTLYVAEGCGDACVLARDFLNKRGIPYTEINLVNIAEIDAFKKSSGSDQIPTMNIGKNWLIRFSEILWGNELDTAGYPPTAPYGFRPVVKAASAPEQSKSE